MSREAPRFWEQKPFSEMTKNEWESLCDGCGQCCLHKLEDEDSGEVFYTDIACSFLNLDSCRCQDYTNRKTIEPNCIVLSPETLSSYDWLPRTCAYRLVSEGKPLAAWHPLLSGDSNSTQKAGISVAGRVLSAEYIHPDDYEERIIRWVL